MKKNKACAVLCKKTYNKREVRRFKTMIDEEYRVHWILDNLPVAVRNEELDFVVRGYPLGFYSSTPQQEKPQHFLYNHVRIIVSYTESEKEYAGARVVGFEVVPFSIKHKEESDALSTCNEFKPADFDPDNFQAVEREGEVTLHLRSSALCALLTRDVLGSDIHIRRQVGEDRAAVGEPLGCVSTWQPR